MEEYRGSLTFFTTYRPTVKTDIYLSPFSPKSQKDEICMTDQVSYNYTGQSIPPQALKHILQQIQSKVSDAFPSRIENEDVDKGLVSGLVFVSERKDGLETLHFSINHSKEAIPKVFQFSNVYGTFDGVRMEDSACFAGDHLIYVSTKEPIHELLVQQPSAAPVIARRQPWTAVYMTNLKTRDTIRLTPKGQADLSPAVSPSGLKIAVASFEGNPLGWDGEIEYLNTNIYVFNVNEPYNRKLIVEGGGWPTWGSENVLYYHKLVHDHWGVFRADVSNDLSMPNISRVTPDDIDSFTPVALDNTKVAVVTIRERTSFEQVKRKVEQYRHIEIFEYSAQEQKQDVPIEKKSIPITQNVNPLADYYNPFLVPGSKSSNGADVGRIGYHRSNLKACPKGIGNHGDDYLEKIESPEPNVELFRVSGAFPSYSPDATKLAFVDNEFKTLYVIFDIEGEKKIKPIIQETESNRVFAPIWSKNPSKDTLYVCRGPAFSPKNTVEIYAILDVCKCNDGNPQMKKLTNGFNNAFPCTNPDGTRLVFRSTKDGGEKNYKNLFIIENLESFENGKETTNITRLTNGPWVDTHCEWSPSGEWIVFASNRDRNSDDLDHGLDTGRFAVYLMKPNIPYVVKGVVIEHDVPRAIPTEPIVVRVIASRCHDFAGHVNHPVFSPDGRSLAVVADLAAVSCDPISLPHFIHSVRPYGDIFIVNIDSHEVEKNKDIMHFTRVTHSRYENSTAVWTMFSCTKCPLWKSFCDFKKSLIHMKRAHEDGGETRHVSGHICIAQRSC